MFSIPTSRWPGSFTSDIGSSIRSAIISFLSRKANVGSEESLSSRLTSVDAIRGAVMILMALDHVRDFFHRGAMQFSPTDLTRTTPVLFLTRWITHFCLPAFVFTTGIGAFLWLRRRNRGKKQLSVFLLQRGALFVLLELTG